MPPFLIYEGPLREEDMAKIAGNEARKRDTLLNSLPRHQGTYKITFPNGRYYIGESTNIQDRVRRLINLFFPSKTKKCAHSYTAPQLPKWCEIALSENNLKSIDDIEIEVLEGSLAENISAATQNCYNLIKEVRTKKTAKKLGQNTCKVKNGE